MKNFHLISNNVKIFNVKTDWRKIKKRIIILCIILLGIISTCQKLNAISIFDFTNQNYTLNQVSKFIKSFENNKLTNEEIYHIFWTCNAFEIHPLVALAIQEKESGTISNPEGNKKYNWRLHRCYGYGLIHQTWNDSGKFYKFGGFYIQVHSGIKAIRKSIDRWYTKNFGSIEMSIEQNEKKVIVNNPIDYALYRYTPFIHGKEDFYKIYERFKSKWDLI